MSSRSLMDRALRRAVPRPIAGHAPPPRALDTGIWVLDRELLHFGTARMPSRSTIVRLGDGSLVVISPPPLADAGTLSALGPVGYVVVPNSFHYLFAEEFMSHHPGARLLVAPGLTERVPELRGAIELGAEPPPRWMGALEYAALGPVRGLSELVFFHVRSGTLVLTDIAFNMTRHARTFDRLVWRANGIPGDFGPGRTSRSLLLRDDASATRCLSRALEWPIARIVVAHGEVVEDEPVAALRRAFARYLP